MVGTGGLRTRRVPATCNKVEQKCGNGLHLTHRGLESAGDGPAIY
nr:MAG TPA: hypothetical protein [Caudoviricetes sp.]